MDTLLRATLGSVGTALMAARDEWWIIGSAAVALHGAAVAEVGDVDVLLSEQDAGRVLSALGLPVAPGRGNRTFHSSIFATYLAGVLPVEFMAGLRYCTGGEWRTLAPATRERIALDGVELFVPARRELRDILLAFGRPKDIARARLLEA